jgi:tetratricopeptide (TPR) repeat protein
MQETASRTVFLVALILLVFAAPAARADLEKADKLRTEKKFAEAVVEYKSVLEKEPENAKALYGIGKSLTEIGRAEQFSDSLWAARQKLEKLVILVPEDPEYRFLNGYSAFFLAPRAPSFSVVLRDLAVKELAASIAARPNHWASWYYLGKVERDRGQLEKAVEAFGKAISIDGEKLDPYPDLALSQYALARFDDCIATARTLLQKSPGYHFSHKIIGDALTAKRDFEAAEKEYLVGAGKAPAQGIWADSLWLLFQRSKDHERAAAVFTELARATPKAEVPRKYLALTLVQLGRHEAAHRNFKVLTGLFPEVPWYYMGLAEACEKLGDDEGAVAGYIEALRLKPDWANPFIPLRARFTAAKTEGRYQDAVDLLRRISASNPHARTHAWVVWELSECLKELGDTEGVIAALKMAMELDSIEPRFHNSLGLYYRVLKRFDESIAEFEKALDLEPGYMYTLENLAATNQQAHKDSAARKWLEEGLQNAQEQFAWAGETEVKAEREFDIFKFSYFLHEMETLEGRKSAGKKK